MTPKAETAIRGVVAAGISAYHRTVRYWAPELMGSAPHIERLVENILDAAPDMAQRLTALEAENATLRDALERIGDQKMWFNLNGELVWTGETPDGNEIETEDPRDIARAALATPPEER